MTGAPPVSGEVVEPLEEGARLQWDTAAGLCSGECRWYHGPRLYLRAARLIHGARADGRFLFDEFRRLSAAGDRRRVLISGAADFGTLAHLVAGYQAAAVPLHVTVLDKCQTPLRMNEWLAERLGVSIETVHGDILTFERPERFDLITTHAFLGRFDRDRRRQVIARWHGLLAPSGAVVTAHRLRESSPPNEITVASTDGERIRQRANRVLSELDRIADADRPQLARWIEEFLNRKMTYPISSISEERAAFEDAGFDPVVFTRQRAVDVDGTSGDQAPRIGIVAHRPPQDGPHQRSTVTRSEDAPSAP